MPVTVDGNNTPTAGGVGYGDGAELAFTAAGSAGQVLQSNGASAPVWAAVPAVNLATGVTGTLPIANGGTGTTSTTFVNLATNVTGTLPIANGGTGTNSTTFVNLATNVSGALPTANGGTGSTSTTYCSLTANVTGTLPVANGGTGITSFGTGVATWLGTPSSANLRTAVTDETGTGSLVFANTPTLVSPILGTPTSGNLQNCTVDGTSFVGYRNIPLSSQQSSSYTLTANDVGKYIRVTSGGSITILPNIFSVGDVVTIYNFTSGNITINCNAVTTFIAGTDSFKSSVTVATRGIANIFFNTATDAVITGNVS